MILALFNLGYKLCNDYMTFILHIHIIIVHYIFYKCSYYVCLPPDTSLPPHTLQNIVSSVRGFWDVGGLLDCLGVPYSVRSQIRDSSAYSSEEKRRVAGVEYYLQTMPGASWGRVAGVLWYLGEHTALEAVRQYLPHKHGE